MCLTFKGPLRDPDDWKDAAEDEADKFCKNWQGMKDDFKEVGNDIKEGFNDFRDAWNDWWGGFGRHLTDPRSPMWGKKPHIN